MTTGGTLGEMNCVILAAGEAGDVKELRIVERGGGAGATNPVRDITVSVLDAVDDVEATVAPRRLMIFSSIRARTETEAVCNGGPVDSFLSSFLLSESFLKYPP